MLEVVGSVAARGGIRIVMSVMSLLQREAADGVDCVRRIAALAAASAACERGVGSLRVLELFVLTLFALAVTVVSPSTAGGG